MRIGKSAASTVCWIAVLTLFVVTYPLPALADETGTINGVVKTHWIERYQAIVYIDRVKGEFLPPAEKLFMSQKGLVFKPHVLPVLKGATVDFTNDDNVVHNVFAPRGSVQMFNLGIYKSGVKKTVTFDKLGEIPLLCIVHPEMLAFVIVLQNPYYAFIDKKGNFEIKDVPAGTYQIKVWHEKFKDASQEVVVEEGKTVFVEFEKKDLRKR